jgi:hypothetical protein
VITGTTITGAGVATGADCGDGVAAGAATGAGVTSCDPEMRMRSRKDNCICYIRQSFRQYKCMQTIPHNATSSQMIAKIGGFIMLPFNKTHMYLRRLLCDLFTDLIGSKINMNAEDRMQNMECYSR